MAVMICKNCGGEFSDELSKCPYCGTMNRKGAYKDFRKRVSAFVDQMLGLKQETERSLSKMILNAFLRSLLIVTIISLLAFLISLSVNVNYLNDKKYDEQAYNDILWEDENLEKLEAAYERGDYELINKMYYENSRVVRNWTHYNAFALNKAYADILAEEPFNQYTLADVLYFLYYPQYFARVQSLNKEEKAEYEEHKESLLAYMKEKGYSEAELSEIYSKTRDGYGYVSSSDLKDYLKEAKDA